MTDTPETAGGHLFEKQGDASALFETEAGERFLRAFHEKQRGEITAADLEAVSSPFFAYIKRLQEVEQHFRQQGYSIVTGSHVAHALPQIDWEAFLAAQHPRHPRGTHWAGEPPREYLAYLEERKQLRDAIEGRIGEPAVQERAVTELLAYTWGLYALREEQPTIEGMFSEYVVSPEDWQGVSEIELGIESLQRILESPQQWPTMAPPFQQGWASTPSVALMRGALRHLRAPWPGDRSAWPEARFSWEGKTPGYLIFTLHENPAGATETERQAAWESVDRLSDWTAVTLATIAAMYQRNRVHHGRLIAETNDFLREWGRVDKKKGSKGTDKDAVNEALFILSKIYIFRLEYQYAAPGRRSRQTHRNWENGSIYPLLSLAQRNRNGRNITWDIQLGPDLLQMAEHFPRQYASIVSGSLGIDGRRPYPGRLDLLLPLEARAHRAVFTQHGIPIREILDLAGVDAEQIALNDRTWWKKYLPRSLDDCASIEHWRFKYPPGDRWADWLATPALIFVKRRNAPEEPESLEYEDATTPEWRA